MKKKGTVSRNILLAFIVLGSLALQLYEVGEPWQGIKDLNGAAWGLTARNFVKHGYVKTRFGPSMNPGPVPEGGFSYYLHHPPIFPFLISFSFHLFGVHEWSARIVPIIFSILSLLFLFRLIRKIWGIEEAYYATFFLAFMPMNLYFSRVVLHEPVVTFGLVLMIWYYVKWREKRLPSDYWKIVGLFAFFGMVDWPAYYILPLLTLHTLILDRGKKTAGKLRMTLLPLSGILIFLIFVVYCYYLSRAQRGSGLLTAFIFRSAVSTGFFDYSILDYIRVEATRGFHLFTPILPLLSLGWLYAWCRKGVRHDIDRNLLVVVVLAFGATHILFFKDASWIHEFWMYHLSAGLALSAGIATVQALKSPFVDRRRGIRFAMAYAAPLFFLVFSVREVLLLHRVDERKDDVVAGMMIHDQSDVDEKIIIDWEDPVPPVVGEYFRYHGTPIYNKPIPNISYYADRNLRWGVKDLEDLRSIVEDKASRYDFFVTKTAYMRDQMPDDIKAYVLKRFDPLFMLTDRGSLLDDSAMAAFLRGEQIETKPGVIVFRKKTASAG